MPSTRKDRPSRDQTPLTNSAVPCPRRAGIAPDAETIQTSPSCRRALPDFLTAVAGASVVRRKAIVPGQFGLTVTFSVRGVEMGLIEVVAGEPTFIGGF